MAAATPIPAQSAERNLPFDFRYSLGRVEDFPLAAWRRALGSAARELGSYGFRYPEIAGSPRLRRALASYLGRARGLDVAEEDLLIVGGSQQGLDLSIRMLLNPGESVVIENPHYPGARIAFRAGGAKLIAIRADADGLDTTQLALRGGSARLVHVTPSHQFPLGGVMPLRRRMELLEWARQASALVIEDDYNSEFRLDGAPIESLASLDDDGRVIYLGTFSKALLPSLRLGFMIVPRPLRDLFVAGKLVMDQGRALLEQEALALFIEEGHFERHVRRIRRLQRERREVLMKGIRRVLGSRAVIHGSAGGLHLVLELVGRSGRETASLVRRAAECGVGVYDLANHFHGRPRFAGLLLGTASLEGEEIKEGIRRLGEVMG